MPAKSSKKELHSVETYISNLQHPLLDDVIALRKLILDVDKSIGESIKWNAPSFYTSEHFATMRFSGKPPLQLILHLGAKKQILPADAIADPGGLLTWLGPDRAIVSFPISGSVAAKRKHLTAILKQWVQHVPVTGSAV
jgi:Domain of unknown function (DU1801)